MIYYPDENHWILKPQNSLHWYEEVRKWIAEFPGCTGRRDEDDLAGRRGTPAAALRRRRSCTSAPSSWASDEA
jgi:hypothetical protein